MLSQVNASALCPPSRTSQEYSGGTLLHDIVAMHSWVGGYPMGEGMLCELIEILCGICRANPNALNEARARPKAEPGNTHTTETARGPLARDLGSALLMARQTAAESTDQLLDW